MSLTPPPLKIDQNAGFEGADLFGVAPFGERLAMIVASSAAPLVIAIDGPWGSGKSVFARQWAGLLRQKKTPVIEFDAFANDYHDDAFIALASAIVAHAKEVKKGNDLGVVTSFIDKAAKVGRALAPVGLKIGVKALTLNTVDLGDGRDFEQAIEAAAADAGTFLEKELADRLNKAESATKMMKNFGEALSGLAKTLAEWERPGEAGVESRLVVIIDELDRCKPSFALDLLEKIKHFYGIEGVSFVLVTHLPQIEAAIKGRYGADTDAATYLQKFISVRFKWNPRGDADRPASVSYVDKCLEAVRPNLHQGHVEVLKFYCERTNASLRTVERICSYIALHPDIMVDTNSRDYKFFGNVILLLICLRESEINITGYKDKTKFSNDALAYLNIEYSSENSVGKTIWAYLMLMKVKKFNEISEDVSVRLSGLEYYMHNLLTLHRDIERRLNGEAV